MFQLTLSSGANARDFLVRKDCCQLGRAADNDVVLHGWRVPRLNARIWRENGTIYIEDVGDHGNIAINGQALRQRAELRHGDLINIGSYCLKLRDINRRRHARPPGSSRARTDPVQAVETPVLLPRPEKIRQAQRNMPVSANPLSDLGFAWQKKLHALLLQTIDHRRADLAKLSDQDLRSSTEKLVVELVDSSGSLPPAIDRQQLIQNVLNEAVGLGPLESLLADDSISEIMVNGAEQVFVERNGQLQACSLRFSSNAAVHHIIERIVAPLGRRIDESMPLVDARLKDGSRVNAIIPPLALQGPCLTIRRFMAQRLCAQDLVQFGSLSAAMVRFLEVCVVQRKNIVISGGTGSGKTTLLNVLSNLIPDGERIITIEDAAELQLDHAHLVTLESRPANLEGSGCISIRDLVRNALRMRPDRIVVGECRGGEALDMLQAMNTGHDGSLTTAHANNPRDLLARLETMVLMAGIDLPAQAIREQIASAIDIIVHQTRFSCGSRKVTHISELTGVDAGKIQLQDIFVYQQTGFDQEGKVRGRFSGCGFVPAFYEELTRIGIELDLKIFDDGRQE